MRKRPLISIVTATYNRADVLRYTLASVARSTFADWEHLVIGDGCTDDTADVVAAAGDPRVRFHNLPANFGEQSAANNAGTAIARGEYVAYLNHDDLWWPDHLETVLDGLRGAGADLACTPVLAIAPDGRYRLLGARRGPYDPTVAVPASSWLVRRELIVGLGGWRPYHRCYTYPSHDLLWRAWRAGADIRVLPRVTVFALLSGERRGVYARREHDENRACFERMCSDSGFREHALLAAALTASSPRDDTTWLARGVRRVLDHLDIPPSGLRLALKYRGKGGFIHELRRRRGLHRLARPRR